MKITALSRLAALGLIASFALGGCARPDEPIVTRYNKLLAKRLGKDPSAYSAIGGVEEMMAMVQQFREAEVYKFVLRPIATGTEDMLKQTRLLIEQLMPEVYALDG